MRFAIAGLIGLTLLWTGSCGSSESSNDEPADGGSGKCCPPDPGPGCCMKMGGWSESGTCFPICDGIPLPSDPGWVLGKDAHDCPVWTNPKNCYGASAGCCGVAPPPDAGMDASSDAVSDGSGDAGECAPGTDYDVKPVALAACDGIAPGGEDCHYRIVIKQGQCCAAKPCDRLVVYWAGGNQTCETGDLDDLLRGYADRRFVAACAQPYTTDGEGGKYPYYAEFDRMHHIMQKLRAEVASIWTGDKLATAGTSHGGTAPLVVTASAQVLKQQPAVWMGKTHTALLLYDGISNPKTLEEWTGAQAAGSGCALFHQRFVGRYGDGTPLVHSCTNNACYCSNPAHAADWAKDTVVIGALAPPSPYTCGDFTPASGNVLYRFASCGGTPGSTACGALGDIVPDEQQSLAYQALKDCPGVTASYADYPTCSHVTCGGFATSVNCGGDDGVKWLEANGW